MRDISITTLCRVVLYVIMDYTIPQSQVAAVIINPGPDGEVILTTGIPVGDPGPNEVLVALSHSGIW